ncbi:MAG: PilZ domain-containing protein [Nitrospiraceae bacterium]|nr:MAG: PilZ domain-containing protein [Nitrospiraceae bacterium]
MKENPKEKRKHTRISISLDAELQINDKTYRGKTKDISFSGIFMFCPDPANIPADKTGFIKLVLKPGPNPKIITFHCKVVRTSESGAGVKLIRVDMEGYQQFKNLMVYNSPNPDVLLEELNKHPGLEIA